LVVTNLHIVNHQKIWSKRSLILQIICTIKRIVVLGGIALINGCAHVLADRRFDLGVAAHEAGHIVAAGTGLF
jgi:hypothetical protein